MAADAGVCLTMMTRFDAHCGSAGAAAAVFLGGSITRGANASRQRLFGYAALVGDWLAARHRSAEVRCHNVGVGGTGSDFGCCRTPADVLAHRPQLVFVEFAVNDAGKPAVRVGRAYEGILRRLREDLPDADIVAIHTLSKGFVPDYEAGGLPESVGLHQAICDHHGVPAVNVGLALHRHMVDTGLPWEHFFADDAHPVDAGHAHYAGTITAALACAGAGPLPPCPPPRTAQVWRSAEIVPGDRLPAGPAWTRRRRRVWDVDMSELVCDKPGTVLEVPFAGRVVGLLVVRGPMTGVVGWSIDGQPEQRLSLWDAYCPKFERASCEILAEDLPPGDHTLTLRLTDEVPEGGRGTACGLYGLMTASFD